MTCGFMAIGRRAIPQHIKECEVCAAQKKANIRERNLKHNQRDEQRLAASAAAKKTSARPEIQAARSEKLRLWREREPERFKEIAQKAMRSAKKSKAEAWMRNHLGWTEAQVVCGVDRKQVDLVSPTKKIWIEVDGHWHFFGHRSKKEKPRPDLLAIRQARDSMLNAEARRRGDVMLVRMAASCFVSSSGRIRDDWLEWLTATLLSPTPGVYCAGELYESAPWALEGCTILRSPTPSTTSSSPTGS